MLESSRIRAAIAASTRHLIASALVALVCSALVFGIWYPFPYSELVGGKELFLIVLTVDLVCGPLLTLIVYDPKKRRADLWRDIGAVVVLQIAALGYGIFTLTAARPVFLAFEGNRFRVVTLPEVDRTSIDRANANLRDLSWTGPRLLGVRVAQGTDPDFRESIQMSLEGLHPSFRPDRWVEFSSQRDALIAELKPIDELRKRYPEEAPLIEEALKETGLQDNKVGFLPLMVKANSSWVVLVSKVDAQPVGFLPLDGW